VVVTNKTASTIAVRIPQWVDRNAVAATLNEKPADGFWTGNHVVYTGLSPKDRLVIQFPVPESKETYTVKWKKTDFWQEGTDPGKNWKNDTPEKFTLTMKGGTLIDVEPRTRDAAYPCFERDAFKATTAPMHQVSRFVSEESIPW